MAVDPHDQTQLSYAQRLQTFQGYWDDEETEATARQLAALGHVCDRPPLESLEEGSRCIECSAFVRRETSVRALDGQSGHYAEGFDDFDFHTSMCHRRQVRIPLEPQATLAGLYGGVRIGEMRDRFERRGGPLSTSAMTNSTSTAPRLQTSSFFTLPTEIRLQIYSLVLPRMESVTSIVPLNRDSARVVTSMGYNKTGPRDLTKTNILRTCCSIHNEALNILYHNVSYQFASTKALYLFLRHIGRNGRQLLSSVDVCCGQREDALAFALLACCERLKMFTIRLSRPRILFPRPPIWMTDGVATLLDLSGLEQVQFAPPDDAKAAFGIDSHQSDAIVVRRELTRPKGAPGTVRWIDGHLDL